MTSSSTKTSTMTTGQTKLYGKDLNEYDEIDVEALLSQLSPEEISMLAKEVDPDDSFLPPSQRCSYECQKSPTGPLDRKKLIEHINKQAMETPDKPELKPYVPGTIRGKKWVPPPQPPKMQEAEEQIAIDMGDEYEQALSDATQEEIIDLAAILGFHSMMNQDQYHASLLNKGQPVGLGWDGITKATQPKAYPADPPNDTDVDKTLQMVKDDSPDLVNLNWNNIKNVSDEKFYALFNALKDNTHLETLSLVNTGLADRHGLKLAEALEKNCTLKILSVETNFLTPAVILRLIKSLLVQRSLEEFRGANQRRYVLGNKIETEITKLVEENPTLLRLGLHLEYNDARQRIATHLQRNIDRIIHHHEKPPKEYHPEYKEDPVPEWKLDTILAKKKPPRPEDIMYAVEDISSVLKESDARRRRSGPVLHPTEMKPPEGSELEPDLNQGEEAHDEPDGVTDPQSQES